MNVGLTPASARVYALTIGSPLSMVVLPQASVPLHWAFGAVPIVFLAAVLARARRLHKSLDDESLLSSPMFIHALAVVSFIQWRHALHGGL